MVRFRPVTGTPVHWVYPGGQPAGTTRFTDTGDAFPASREAYAARYGTVPSQNGVDAVLPVYAEAIGVLARAMELASLDPLNPWGLEPGVPTDLEVEDFAATQCPQGRNSAIFRAYLPGSVPPPRDRNPPPPPPPVEPTLPSPAEQLEQIEAFLLLQGMGDPTAGTIADNVESAIRALSRRPKPIVIPEDVRVTVKLLDELAERALLFGEIDAAGQRWGNLRIGAGRRARLARLRQWLESL
jgi:hypothetical protein